MSLRFVYRTVGITEMEIIQKSYENVYIYAYVFKMANSHSMNVWMDLHKYTHVEMDFIFTSSNKIIQFSIKIPKENIFGGFTV